MNELLKKLKNIKDEAYSLINEVDNKINKTSISVELSVSEIKQIIGFVEDGFRQHYRYDWYLREECEILKKLKKLI